jgi:hypothetical protein
MVPCASITGTGIISFMNILGLICALTAFLNIWLGHVSVRFIEARAVSIKPPVTAFVVVGFALLAGAYNSSVLPVSAVLGITGTLMLWDAFEFIRQQRRVINGHAPANPGNPRHRRILAEYPLSSSIQWLKREPCGHVLSAAELKSIREALE